MSNSETEWWDARSPNYYTNEDKNFPYSELPYIGEHKLVKIPLDGLVNHVDYWGEGRIITSAGVSGFPNCYNINLEYQLVSRGPDAGRKIPNRVPVKSNTECNSSSYIKDNSVAIVTVMGARINNSCADDIYRMVNKTDGKVILYGFANDSKDVEDLKLRLEGKEFILYPNYVLPSTLSGITLYDTWRAYLGTNIIQQELYNSVVNRDFDKAVNISKTIEESSHGSLIYETVMRLLTDRVKYTLGYAYKLWHNNAREIVRNNFPETFKLILNDDYLIIKNKRNGLPLKLDVHKDRYNDRLAWGDGYNVSSNRLSWKLIPVWEQNMLYYKIKNIDTNMYLKLDVNVDSYGDRQAWGSNNSGEKRHLWSFEPLKYGDDILFFIVNHQYNQGLKLDANTDSYNDRLLWGHNASVYGDPGYFCWFINQWIQ